ncbi:MAG TPA: hypothetical protein VJQ52_24105 [Steroidobacteraceae bacterium]|nr:hypothetical protein [Steroidobacteraceae bacterium]
MAGRKSTRRANASRKRNTDLAATDARIVLTIEAQRRRLFQVSAIAACLGHALEDICAPGKLAPELQNVTDAMIQLLDDAAAALDPSILKLQAAHDRSVETRRAVSVNSTPDRLGGRLERE